MCGESRKHGFEWECQRAISGSTPNGLTFGLVSEHKQWKKFREASNTEMEFLHRDEFEQKYNQKFEYPVILKEDNEISVMIDKAELNEIKTLDQLISQVEGLPT